MIEAVFLFFVLSCYLHQVIAIFVYCGSCHRCRQEVGTQAVWGQEGLQVGLFIHPHSGVQPSTHWDGGPHRGWALVHTVWTLIWFNFPLSHYYCIEIMWGCWLYCDLLWLKELNGSCEPVSFIQIKCTFFWLVIGVAAALVKWTVVCSRQTIGTYDSVTLMCLEPDAAISIKASGSTEWLRMNTLFICDLNTWPDGCLCDVASAPLMGLWGRKKIQSV